MVNVLRIIQTLAIALVVSSPVVADDEVLQNYQPEVSQDEGLKPKPLPPKTKEQLEDDEPFLTKEEQAKRRAKEEKEKAEQQKKAAEKEKADWEKVEKAPATAVGPATTTPTNAPAAPAGGGKAAKNPPPAPPPQKFTSFALAGDCKFIKKSVDCSESGGSSEEGIYVFKSGDRRAKLQTKLEPCSRSVAGEVFGFIMSNRPKPDDDVSVRLSMCSVLSNPKQEVSVVLAQTITQSASSNHLGDGTRKDQYLVELNGKEKTPKELHGYGTDAYSASFVALCDVDADKYADVIFSECDSGCFYTVVSLTELDHLKSKKLRNTCGD